MKTGVTTTTATYAVSASPFLSHRPSLSAGVEGMLEGS